MSCHKNTEFNGSLPGHDQSTTRRLIGQNGCGIKRITDTCKAQFPGCRCYIRANRTTNIFTIRAWGTNGESAVQLAAKMIQDETAFILGTGPCPHPHLFIPTNGEHGNLVPHIIGSKGANIKIIQAKVTQAHGIGCFIVHKKGYSGFDTADGFLIEGITSVQVQFAKSLLNDLIQKIQNEQTVVQVDLSTPNAPNFYQQRHTNQAPQAKAAKKSKGKAKAAKKSTEDTNSFSSLAASSSDDEASDDEASGALTKDQLLADGYKLIDEYRALETNIRDLDETSSTYISVKERLAKLTTEIDANQAQLLDIRDREMQDGLHDLQPGTGPCLRRQSTSVPPAPPANGLRQKSSAAMNLGFTHNRPQCSSHNRQFQLAKEAIAEKKGCHPRYVRDHEVNAWLAQNDASVPDSEDAALDLARKTTLTADDFPSTSSEEGIRLEVTSGAWAAPPGSVTASTGETYSHKSDQAASVAKKEMDRKVRQFTGKRAAHTVSFDDQPSEAKSIQVSLSTPPTSIFSVTKPGSSWNSDSSDEDDHPSVVIDLTKTQAAQIDKDLAALDTHVKNEDAVALQELEDEMVIQQALEDGAKDWAEAGQTPDELAANMAAEVEDALLLKGTSLRDYSSGDSDCGGYSS
jgi:hypothetical protein